MTPPRLSLDNAPLPRRFSMRRSGLAAIMALLLALLLLLAEAGALAHGYTHLPDQTSGDEPVCALCLAFAALGAGAASAPPTWSAPAATFSFDALIPLASPTAFRPTYQSRAPPSPNR